MKTRTYPRHLESRMDRYRKKKPPFSFTTYTQRERDVHVTQYEIFVRGRQNTNKYLIACDRSGMQTES